MVAINLSRSPNSFDSAGLSPKDGKTLTGYVRVSPVAEDEVETKSTVDMTAKNGTLACEME